MIIVQMPEKDLIAIGPVGADCSRFVILTDFIRLILTACKKTESNAWVILREN